MKIVIAGAGEVGTHLAKMLADGKNDIIVIDNEENHIYKVESNLDLLTVTGSATSIQVLKEADVKNADLFLAVAHFEETNITASILAKKLGAKKVIARIENPEYLDVNNKALFVELGIDYLIHPEHIAAREVMGHLITPGNTEVFDFVGGKLLLFVIRLKDKAKIIDTEVKSTEKVLGDNNRLVGLSRDGETLIPNGDTVIHAKDVLYVISNQLDNRKLFNYCGVEQSEGKDIMIVGGSGIGKYICKELQKQFEIKIVESDRDKSFKLADFLDSTLVINGDGRDVDLLIDEGLTGMDTFISVTGNSETNILAAQFAKRMGVKRVIAEVENLDYVSLAENTGIDTIINKKLVAASRIFRFTMSSEVSFIRCLTGTNAEVMEFVVKDGSKVTKNIIKDVKFPNDCYVAGMVRGQKGQIVTGSTQLKELDRVILFALPASFNDIGSYFN